MIENRGSWYMLIVAFLFAASINYDKPAMLNSDPVFGMVFTLLIISGAFAVLVVISNPQNPASCVMQSRSILPAIFRKLFFLLSVPIMCLLS